MRWYWFARALILAVIIILGTTFFISRGNLTHLEYIVLLGVSPTAIIVVVFILYDVSKPRDKETPLKQRIAGWHSEHPSTHVHCPKCGKTRARSVKEKL